MRRSLLSAVSIFTSALLGALLVTPGLLAEEPAAERVQPLPVEIASIELVAALPPAAPLLRVHLVNRSPQTIAGWSFEVEAAGRPVDGYRDLLVLKPVRAGETAPVELFRLDRSHFETSSTLRVRVMEAWAAEWVENEDGSNGEWRLLESLEGEPVESTADMKP